jgi:threonine dehydrogenase-like Zn-dependent dehydrogenase
MGVPEPQAGEVLVRVSACGICGSDLTSYKRGLFTGVPGHEVAGLVEAVGAGLAGWRVGDPVVIEPGAGCGRCDQCRGGNRHRCVESLTGRSTRPGGCAELIAAHENVVRRLPDGLSPEDACLAEPLAVALHGVSRLAVRPGEDAVVLGLGSIGLLAVAALRWRGAAQVAGVDPVEVRRRLAGELGAEPVLESARQARGEIEGAPVVLECSGRPESLQQAIDLASPGGRVALLGIAIAEVSVVPGFWVTREITVSGSINSQAGDFEEALGMLAARREVARIITRRVGLPEVPAVFKELLHPSGVGKVVVDPRR